MALQRKRSRSSLLFKFDAPYRERHGVIAGVDEAGRGPLAGPVVAAAVILPHDLRIPHLADSKLLNADQRWALYRLVQRSALAIGVGVAHHHEIDRVNIYWASLGCMQIALNGLMISPSHVLVDGFKIPKGPASQSAIIDGDRKSASIAAAAIVAKVTRDCMMEALDREYPGYGFKQHKGYTTRLHLKMLDKLGPCAIHRRSFAPVQLALSKNRKA